MQQEWKTLHKEVKKNKKKFRFFVTPLLHIYYICSANLFTN